MDPEDTLALMRLLAAGGRGEPRRLLISTHGGAAAALRAGPAAWRAAGLDIAQRAALATADPGPEVGQWRRWLEAGP
ncbi:MAG TPA: DNA-protecting protein DprA, partial [Luteimonas sp.]